MLLPLLISLAFTSLLLGLAPYLLRHDGLLDKPNERSSHSQPTLRGAGIFLAIAAISVSILLDFPWLVAVALIFFVLLGFLDDIFSLPAVARLIAQLLFALLLIWVLDNLLGPATISVMVTASLVVLTVLIVNETNFMDGINGMSVACGLVISISFATLLALEDQLAFALLMMAVAGACLAFMPWNFRRNARLFLGDSGSYFLGAAYAMSILVLLLQQVSPIVALAPLTVYVFDTSSVIAWRLIRRENFMQAHRGHAYQRLVQSGFSHVSVAVAASVVSGLCGFAAVIVQMEGISNAALAGVCVAFGLLWILSPLAATRYPRHF